VKNCWVFKSGVQRIFETSWWIKNKSSLNILYRNIQCRCRVSIAARIVFWPNQHNEIHHKKPTFISSAWFKPATIERTQTYVLHSADTRIGRWAFCYWTVIQNCYTHTQKKEFVISVIQLVTISKSRLEVSTHDLWRPYKVVLPLKIP